jgi:ketosteroid isomerase-like protein
MMQTDLIDETDDKVIVSGVSEIPLPEARRLVAMFADVTTSKDVDKFLSGFTDDCVVQFGRFATMYGKQQLRPFVASMFSPRLKDFTCQKRLRTLNGNVIGGTWTSEWVDAQSGKKKFGRGFEFWIMRGGRIARWDAAFNSWDASKDGGI